MKKKLLLSLLLIITIHLKCRSNELSHLEQMRALYQRAEYAMKLKDYQKAKESFLSLLSFNPEPSQDICTFADCLIRLAFTQSELGFLTEAENTLNKLLIHELPAELSFRARMQQTKIMLKQKKLKESYLLLSSLQETTAFEKWSIEDRAHFCMAEELIIEQYDKMKDKAKSYFLAGLLNDAEESYLELLTLSHTLDLPLPYSEKREVLKTLTKILYQKGKYKELIFMIKQQGLVFNSLKDKDIFPCLARSYIEVGQLDTAAHIVELLSSTK